MSQPVIFDIAYTPYRLKKGSSQADIDKHAKDRAFFDMSGQDNNIYKYMTELLLTILTTAAWNL